jgi:hypothetical protein
VFDKKSDRVMEKKVLGMTAYIKDVISRGSEKCARCEKETATCAKLYLKAGNNRTVCVEMEA